jgi:hypothetical protein
MHIDKYRKHYLWREAVINSKKNHQKQLGNGLFTKKMRVDLNHQPEKA